MRFIHWYLIAYFLLLFGAGLSLWQAGVLSRVNPMLVILGLIVSVGLGIVLAVTARRSTAT
jgi:hypothetical protein